MISLLYLQALDGRGEVERGEEDERGEAAHHAHPRPAVRRTARRPCSAAAAATLTTQLQVRRSTFVELVNLKFNVFGTISIPF